MLSRTTSDEKRQPDDMANHHCDQTTVFKSITYAVTDAIAWVMLNRLVARDSRCWSSIYIGCRTRVCNAISRDMTYELDMAFTRACDDPQVSSIRQLVPS